MNGYEAVSFKPGRVQQARQIGGSMTRVFNNLFNKGFLLQVLTFSYGSSPPSPPMWSTTQPVLGS